MINKISQEEILRNAPAVLETTFRANLSHRYTHIPTSELIKDMEDLGWVAVRAQQQNSRDENKRIHKKHLVTFRNPKIKVESKEGDDIFPQILIINSHDGSSSFQFRVGIFRLVCSNGLVIATEDFGKTSLRHSGYSFEELKKIVFNLTKDIPNTIQMLNKLNKIELDEEKQKEFVEQAIKIRFGEKSIGYDSEELLRTMRSHDEGNTIWKILNKVQEHLTHGTFNYTNKGVMKPKRRKARGIKNFHKDIDMNERLFRLAYSFAKN
jgi:hypothetical protein